jgi:hypothetical protein
MAFTFSVVAIAAEYGGHWVVRLNQDGRLVAMLIFLILGLSLLFPSVTEIISRLRMWAGQYSLLKPRHIPATDVRDVAMRFKLYRFAFAAIAALILFFPWGFLTEGWLLRKDFRLRRHSIEHQMYK